jgi:hypothetical protein
MALLNYTTKVDPDKSAQEIAKCLSMHGAQAVLTEYDKERGIVSAISFQIEMNDRKVGFRLPCDWKPVLEIMKRDPKIPRNLKNELQAVRTSWRIVKDWVEAQMALVETQMVTTQDVFLPYAVMADGRTLSQHAQTNPSFLLGQGN